MEKSIQLIEKDITTSELTLTSTEQELIVPVGISDTDKIRLLKFSESIYNKLKSNIVYSLRGTFRNFSNKYSITLKTECRTRCYRFQEGVSEWKS